MKNNWIKISMLLLIGSVGCTQQQKQKGMTQLDLSTIICNCASPVVNFNVELRSLAQANDMGALAQRMTDGERIMQIAVDCVIAEIDEKSKSLIDDELSKLIADQCKLDRRMTADFFEKIDGYNFPSF